MLSLRDLAVFDRAGMCCKGCTCYPRASNNFGMMRAGQLPHDDRLVNLRNSTQIGQMVEFAPAVKARGWSII